jgi:hypothetical protein
MGGLDLEHVASGVGNSVIPSQSSTVWRRAAAVVFGSSLTYSVNGYSH